MRSLTVYFLPSTEKNRIRVGQLPKSVDILAVFHTKGIDQLSDFYKKATSEQKNQINEAFEYWLTCYLTDQKNANKQDDLVLDKTYPKLARALHAQAKYIAKQIKQHPAYLR